MCSSDLPQIRNSTPDGVHQPCAHEIVDNYSTMKYHISRAHARMSYSPRPENGRPGHREAHRRTRAPPAHVSLSSAYLGLSVSRLLPSPRPRARTGILARSSCSRTRSLQDCTTCRASSATVRWTSRGGSVMPGSTRFLRVWPRSKPGSKKRSTRTNGNKCEHTLTRKCEKFCLFLVRNSKFYK